jgi:phosphoenolpyruvate-protein kinase (PTS system EI component)
MIAEAAYFRAERRGFNGGDPVKDWIEAEAEVDARLRQIEIEHLVTRLEEGLATASKKLTSLKKKVSGLKAEARAEWQQDVEKLASLRDSLQMRITELRQQGEQAGHKAKQQAEKVWEEITETIHRVGERARH